MVIIACEFGQRITNRYEEIDYQIKAFDWYLFPYEIQKMLPTILSTTQQPVELECFGSFTVVREFFKKVLVFNSIQVTLSHFDLIQMISIFSLQVIKAAFSYFMTIRKFIK